MALPKDTALTRPCTRCGRPVAHSAPPPSLRPEDAHLFCLDARPHPNAEVRFRALTDTCAACLYERERAQAEAELGRRGLAPPPLGWALRTVAADAAGGEWEGWSYLVFGALLGMIVGDERALDTAPVPWSAFYDQRGPAVVVIQRWYVRLRYRDTPLVLVGRWSPGRDGEKIAMHGLEAKLTKRIRRDVEDRGLELLRELNMRGRKKGHEVPREQFVRDYNAVYREELDRRGVAPSQYDVAAAMGMGRSTLNEYLSDYGIPWPPPIRP